MTEFPVARINTAAISQNFDRLRDAYSDCNFMAVVKANAYGHGLAQVAQILKQADALGVARISEGKYLRALGIDQRIVILEGCSSTEEIECAAKLELEIVVHDLNHLDLIKNLSAENKLHIWLKIDTGMGRLGVHPQQFQDCINFLDSSEVVAKPIKVITHLASAEKIDNSITAKQVKVFGETIGMFNGDISFANSAAILSWRTSFNRSPTLNFSGKNWLRPGLALFGVSPFPEKISKDLNLIPAMTFESCVIAIKTIKKDAFVGYGSTWQAKEDTNVAVVAVGYGDGYPRQLPQGTPVLINKYRAKLIGRVSMDMITVDITDIPLIKIGDPALLWGESLPIEEIASLAQMIPYELMCGLSNRVKRIYIN
ncbi:MAG: alanine racemase [Pseudomonadota bacterium]|nr:alanine racemase [Pseudomonadota bacterium]